MKVILSKELQDTVYYISYSEVQNWFLFERKHKSDFETYSLRAYPRRSLSSTVNSAIFQKFDKETTAIIIGRREERIQVLSHPESFWVRRCQILLFSNREDDSKEHNFKRIFIRRISIGDCKVNYEVIIYNYFSYGFKSCNLNKLWNDDSRVLQLIPCNNIN